MLAFQMRKLFLLEYIEYYFKMVNEFLISAHLNLILSIYVKSSELITLTLQN